MAEKNLEILVLLRESCDPRPPATLMSKGAGISERGLRRVANPADLEALERALKLKDSMGATVNVVAVGPERLDDTLRLAISMGADRAIRVSGAAFAGGDCVADATLWQRIFSILLPDLVLTGNRLMDRGSDPAPALAAVREGLGCVTAGVSLHISSDQIEVMRKGDRGARQKISARIPCAILFDAGFEEIRYPAMDKVIDSLSHPVEIWGLAELGLPEWEVGSSGSALVSGEYASPRPDPLRTVTPDPALPAFDRILALLSGGIQPREGKMHFLPAEEVADSLIKIFQHEGLLPGAES